MKRRCINCEKLIKGKDEYFCSKKCKDSGVPTPEEIVIRAAEARKLKAEGFFDKEYA